MANQPLLRIGHESYYRIRRNNAK